MPEPGSPSIATSTTISPANHPSRACPGGPGTTCARRYEPIAGPAVKRARPPEVLNGEAVDDARDEVSTGVDAREHGPASEACGRWIDRSGIAAVRREEDRGVELGHHAGSAAASPNASCPRPPRRTPLRARLLQTRQQRGNPEAVSRMSREPGRHSARRATSSARSEPTTSIGTSTVRSGAGGGWRASSPRAATARLHDPTSW